MFLNKDYCNFGPLAHESQRSWLEVPSDGCIRWVTRDLVSLKRKRSIGPSLVSGGKENETRDKAQITLEQIILKSGPLVHLAPTLASLGRSPDLCRRQSVGIEQSRHATSCRSGLTLNGFCPLFISPSYSCEYVYYQ